MLAFNLNGVKLLVVKNKLTPEALEFFRKHGARGGKIGGKRRLETMTPEQRSAIAKKAATASVKARKITKAQQKLK